MGLLARLRGSALPDQEYQRFQQYTEDPAWDVLLTILLVKLQDLQLNFHQYRGRDLIEKQAVADYIQKLLAEIETAGGRVILGDLPEEPEEVEDEITPEKHFGVPHFLEREVIKAQEKADAG